ncbi:PaaI family thioesterase [Methylobacterium nodulans]|uniref:Thioesterase superfamily protein n=1 Tax=Methylobacterium nodulans (strain LMG 21967 / CNCM I-2342 / ORS 2060) TaxID=460265 RepID=B8I9H8_METNO|nr:PaaI family thioesterase [Methylobacterium nodulans]ACL55231.1 thioesterase superfamily protein [Methylobacterium nodulans ORS 2060]
MDEGQGGTIFGAEIPFARLCGVEALRFENGRTHLRLVLGPEHANNLGIAHGGVLCTLLDIAMGTVARLTAGRPVVTLDMQTRFLSPGRGVLLAEGRVVRAGQSILFCDAEVRGEAGTLVASASGVFKPTGLREPASRRPGES